MRSTIDPDAFIINDETPDHIVTPDEVRRGLEPHRRLMRSASPDDYAYGGIADPFPKEMLISKNDAMEMIKERTARGLTNKQRAIALGIKAKDQKQTNFCWANGPCQIVEFIKAVQCGWYEEYSSASVACKINGFANQGGIGVDAVEYAAKHGYVPARLWPNAAISRQYDTAEAWEEAKASIITEWWETKPRNAQEQWSVLLQSYPGAGGYNWWSHEVGVWDPVIVDGDIGFEGRNQWLGYGNDNWFIFQGNRGLADDFVVPRLIAA